MPAPKLDLVYWNGLSIRGNGNSLPTEKKSLRETNPEPGDNSDFKKRFNSMLEYAVDLNFAEIFQPPTVFGPDLIILSEIYPNLERASKLSDLENDLITQEVIRRKYKTSLFPMNKRSKEYFLIVYRFEKLKIEVLPDPEYQGVLQMTVHMLAKDRKNVTGFYKILAVHLPNSGASNGVYRRLGQNKDDFQCLIGDTNHTAPSSELNIEDRVQIAKSNNKKSHLTAGLAGLSRKELAEHENSPEAGASIKKNRVIGLRPGVKQLIFQNETDITSTSLRSEKRIIDRVWHLSKLAVIGKYLPYGEEGDLYSFNLSPGEAEHLINPKDKQASVNDTHGITLSKKGVGHVNYLMLKGMDYLNYLVGKDVFFSSDVDALEELASTGQFSFGSIKAIKKLRITPRAQRKEIEAIKYLQMFKVRTSNLSDHRPMAIRMQFA